ncbi:MAG: polymorphic toxin type 50 domain-containing protein [Clostridiales bacterium]|nr:polymorphic toxin type 50 domain-containing protein [Clostridiales bacterium]
MTYREWYEKYVSGNPQAKANEKKIRNKAADRKQYAEYRQILGENAPKTFAEFQQMKYTDSEAWDALKNEKQIATIRADIQAGKYNLTVNPGRQARHFADGNQYKGNQQYQPGKSYLSIGMEDVQQLVRQCAGTGKIILLRKYPLQFREYIVADHEIGTAVDLAGNEFVTRCFSIHYSKAGVHIVPEQEEDSR